MSAEHKVLELRGVEQVFGHADGTRVHALAGVDLDVFAADFVIVIGANGSGKSSLLQAISGGRHTAGKIMFDAEDVTSVGERARANRIGLVTQHAEENTVGDLTVLENLALGHLRNRTAGFQVAVNPEFREKARADLSRLGMDFGARLDMEVAEFSGGERQVVSILLTLAMHPRLLLLDEPTASLDSQRTRFVEDLVCRFSADTKAPVLWVTHDATQALALGNRLLVMERGKIAADLGTEAKQRLAEADIGRWIRGTATS